MHATVFHDVRHTKEMKKMLLLLKTFQKWSENTELLLYILMQVQMKASYSPLCECN